MAQNRRPAEDRRIQRSRAAMLRALFELTVEKGYDSVSISDIAARANVNRSTFYRHYFDKHELLDRYLDEVQARVKAAAQRAEAMPASVERVPAGLWVLLEHVRANSAFFAVMLGPKGDPAFVERFRRIIEARYRTVLGRQKAANKTDELKVAYISQATVGALLWWLAQKHPPTAEAFAVQLGQLSMTVAAKTLSS